MVLIALCLYCAIKDIVNFLTVSIISQSSVPRQSIPFSNRSLRKCALSYYAQFTPLPPHVMLSVLY